jgi:hypothetical protein
LLVLAWSAEGLTTWTYGAGEKYLQTNTVSVSARWLRSGVVEFKETSTVKVAGQRDENVSTTLSVNAANGLVSLAAKTVIVVGGKTSGTVGDKLVALEQMQGSIFPAEVGKKFSFRERHAGTSSYPGGNSNFSVDKSCEYVGKLDASEIHPRLRGIAYVLRCKIRQTGVAESVEDLKLVEALGVPIVLDKFTQSEPLLRADGNTYGLGKLKDFLTVH